MKRLLWLVVLVTFFSLSFMGAVMAKDPKAPQKTPELVSTGKKLYETNCASCHGAKGEGKGPAAAALTPHPVDFAQPLKNWPNTKGNPEKIFEVISKGIPNSAMVGWSQLSEKDRWGLVFFVMEFAKKK
jgi:high-affinity iron transporter